MNKFENKRVILDLILLGLSYALVFTALVFFVYPLEISEFSDFNDVITHAFGSAFAFGSISGLFCGFFGSFWISRLEFKSQTSAGLITGACAVIIGSIIFPFIGAFIRTLYFGTNPADFTLEIRFLFNYSMMGIFPGIFTGIIAGMIGGLISPDINTGAPRGITRIREKT